MNAVRRKPQVLFVSVIKVAFTVFLAPPHLLSQTTKQKKKS
jgi:hypothetical protein